MKKEDFIAKIQEIGTIKDDSKRRSILAELQDEVSKDYDEKENLEKTKTGFDENLNKLKTTYEEKIQKLESANMDLFLRVGSQSAAAAAEEKTGIKDEEPKRKFEDLFDENGRIK